VRLLGAVGAAEVRELGALRVVAVLQQVEGLRDAAGAEVDRHHRLDVGLPAPRGELVDPELVGLDRTPGQVEAPGSLVKRPDAVLPAVAGDEVAARVADRRRPELADQLEHVASEAPGVRRGVVRLVEAGVDAAAHVLGEGTEQSSVHGADAERRVEGQARREHQTGLQRCMHRCK
jgi:hypothetical protein